MGANISRKSVSMKGYMLIAALSVLICTGITGCARDNSAEEYVTQVIETAVDGWNADALYEMTSPQFRTVASREKVGEMFELYSELGALKNHSEPEGRVLTQKMEDDSEEVLAAYQVAAEFEKENATIDVVLIRTDSGWTVYGFNVFSNYVMNAMEAKKREAAESAEPAGDVL